MTRAAPRRGGWLALVLAWGGTPSAVGQSLPEAFDPIGTTLEEPPPLGWLLALPRGAVHQWAAGLSSVSLGRGARASFAPLGWTRREDFESGNTWVVQVQTDGYKRITSALVQRSGWSDLTASTAWERALGERLKGRAAVGLILPSHGEVGGRREAALLSGGLVQSLPGRTGQLGATLSALHGAPPGTPGGSRTVLRADMQWSVAWAPTFRTALSGVRTRQDAAPALGELALAIAFVPQPGTELRTRAWAQQIDGAPRRSGLSVAVAQSF